MKHFITGLLIISIVPVCSVAQQRVGINTTNPSATLDVNGTIKTDSITIPASHYYMYSTEKSDTIFLPPTVFQKAGTASGNIIYDVNGTEMHFDGTPAAVIGYCVAPVILPNGATITNLTAYVLDNSPQSVTLSLYETVAVTGANGLIAFGTTNTNSPSIVTISISPFYTVDNTTKTNSIKVVLGNDASVLSKLYGVRVVYTVGHVN